MLEDPPFKGHFFVDDTYSINVLACDFLSLLQCYFKIGKSCGKLLYIVKGC